MQEASSGTASDNCHTIYIDDYLSKNTCFVYKTQENFAINTLK